MSLQVTDVNLHEFAALERLRLFNDDVSDENDGVWCVSNLKEQVWRSILISFDLLLFCAILPFNEVLTTFVLNSPWNHS